MTGKTRTASEDTGPEELSDATVRDYLKDHPDFFERHPDMLDHLHISHSTGSAVSLVEKQVSVLRERKPNSSCKRSSFSTRSAVS